MQQSAMCSTFVFIVVVMVFVFCAGVRCDKWHSRAAWVAG